MKSALFKDTAREIKRSFGRFMAVFLIVMLGCGFFAGIKATMPDMVDMAEDYFNENALMDMKLVSNIGIKSKDVEAVKKASHVSGAMAAYSKDVFYLYENRNIVLKMMSYNDRLAEDSDNDLNRLSLSEGRMPQTPGECLVEKCLGSPDTFKIGNKITVTEPDKNKDLSETLRHSTYKIVGIVNSPLYIGYERDVSSVGTGTVNSNVYLPESEFCADYYSELYITFDNCRGLDPFSDEYRNTVKKTSKDAIAVFKKSIDEKYDDLTSKAQTKLESAQSSIDKLRSVTDADDEALLELRNDLIAQIKDTSPKYKRAADKGLNTQYLYKSLMEKAEDHIDIIDELRADEDGSAHEKYKAQLADAQAQLEQSKADLAEFSKHDIYHFDRFEASTDYNAFQGDAMKIDSISRVFPVFFIIVAALVCLTTMTRMVEEQRTTIGTYKALGYGGFKIASKYLVYCSLAAVLGCAVGVSIGLVIFPKIIYTCYKIMYNIPEIATPFRPVYMLWCMVVSVACVCAAAGWTCYLELKTQPAQLMRPKPPKAGRRVLLERVPFIWNKLGFLAKVTVRNLLRYKKRFFMTLAGIAGCTALIITGFGLKYSIKTIADMQFRDVFLYDGIITLNTADFSEQEIVEHLSSIEELERTSLFMQASCDVIADKDTLSVSLITPGDEDGLDGFVALRSVDSGETLSIVEGKAIVTQKLADLCSLKKGDEITLKRTGYDDISIEIADISKNYALHYVYITPSTYEKLYGEKPLYNASFAALKDDVSEDTFKQKLTEDDMFYGLTYKSDSSKGFLNSVDSLDAVVILLIVCAGGLAFIVLYNLANINMTERRRELATVKVLGFFDGETSAYIYRENIISAVIGILLGFVVGVVLHRFVVLTSEVDVVMFNRKLVWWAYALGALLTVVFTFLVNVILHFKLKKIDMVESLKSVE